MTPDKIYLGTDLIYGGGGGSVPSDEYPIFTSDGVATASSIRNSFTTTASATPNTAGSWVQIIAATTADSAGILYSSLSLGSSTGVDSSAVLEIGTGGSGSEVLWARVLVGYRQNVGDLIIPGFIPSGTRVTARFRSVIASRAANGVFSFIKPKTDPASAPIMIGDTNTNTTSKGITLTAPGSLNTKSAWTELSASTSAEINRLSVTMQGAGGTTMDGSGVLVDIGIGGAGSETVVIPNIFILGTSGETYSHRNGNIFGVNIPSGSRVAARYARANANNGVDILLVGA